MDVLAYLHGVGLKFLTLNPVRSVIFRNFRTKIMATLLVVDVGRDVRIDGTNSEHLPQTLNPTP